MGFDPERSFEYENGFYLTAGVARFAKLTAHLDFFRQTSELPGELVECGVFKGASLMRWIKFRSLLEHPFSRRVVAFDTFGAFPEATYAPDSARRARFVEEGGDRSISRQDLQSLLQQQSLDQNVELVEGDILKTVPEYLERNAELRISLLHIDVDLYEPTRVCLEAFYPRVVRGGLVILDDYGAFPGANKAIEEFLGPLGVEIRKPPQASALSYVVKA